MKLSEAFNSDGGGVDLNLKKQIKGVPVWVWVALVVAGIAVAIYLRKRRSEAEAEAEAAPVDPYQSPYFGGSGGGAIGSGGGSGSGYGSGLGMIPDESAVVPEVTGADIDNLLAQAWAEAQRTLEEALAEAQRNAAEASERDKAAYEAEIERIRQQIEDAKSNPAPTGPLKPPPPPSPISIKTPFGPYIVDPATGRPTGGAISSQINQNTLATAAAANIKTNNGNGNNKGGNSNGNQNKPGWWEDGIPGNKPKGK